MNDAQARWRLPDFDSLYWHSRALDLPAADWREGFSLTFWFWVADAERKQVIVHNETSGGVAWEIAIHHRQFILRTAEMRERELITLPISGQGWHQAVLSISGSGTVRFALDDFRSSITLAALRTVESRANRLIVGGYTDPAGGHYDHTFGRAGSGLIDDVRVYARALTEAEIAAFVTRPQAPPRAGFIADPPSGDAPLDVGFAARTTASQQGEIAYYLWDFGDGERASGAVVTHRYAYAGNYRARLTVIDSHHGQTVAALPIAVTGRENPLRVAPVFVNGTEGYACYRIPSIVRALNGDLLAFAEARLESCSDSTGTIRIVCKRSSDGGATWSPLQVIAAVDGFVAMNAAPVVDEVYETGRIVVVFRAASHSEWDIARGVGISRAMCVFSDDGGATWSAPRDITSQVHKPYNPAYRGVCPAAGLPQNQTQDWRIQIPSQGHAIQLTRHPAARGRLFFAGSLTRGDRSIFESENYAFWSDDIGATWQIGGIIPRLGLNEAIAAELEDGGVMFNTRAYTQGQPDGRRAITQAWFDEDGAIHFDETFHDETLIDPAVQATLLRYTWRDQAEFGGKSRLLFANPAHTQARANLTVRLSYDDGHTWAYSKVVDRGAAAYSDLVVTRDMTIGLLYERGNTGGIHFVTFTLDWLTDGEDRV